LAGLMTQGYTQIEYYVYDNKLGDDQSLPPGAYRMFVYLFRPL